MRNILPLLIFLISVMALFQGIVSLSHASGRSALLDELRGGDGGVYIDLTVDKVEVDKWEVVKGEKVTFTVTIWNRGEFSEHTIILRALTGNKILTSEYARIDDWDVKDKKVVTLTWDTKNSVAGSYPVTIEAFLHEDVDDFDNEVTLPKPIIVK